MNARPEHSDRDLEDQRERSLTGYGLGYPTDGPHVDDEFARVAGRARDVTGAEEAFVNILVGDRQLMFDAEGRPAAVTERAASICDHAMWQADEDGVVAVTDTSRDPALADNAWVSGELGSFRFYAAAPLIGREGLPLGTICCLSRFPRLLDQAERSALRRLADLTVQILEVRRHVEDVERC